MINFLYKIKKQQSLITFITQIITALIFLKNLFKMKWYFGIVGLIFGLFLSCNASQGNKTFSDTKNPNNDTIRISNEELEYEIIIFDPGFNAWLRSNARPRGYCSQSYLETRNRA